MPTRYLLTEIGSNLYIDNGQYFFAQTRDGLGAQISADHSLADGLFDSWAWGNSQDALIAGAGNPQVRAGVLRILATLPDVSVAQTTTDGQPTLTLTATAPAMPSGYQEQLIIGADTGIPVKFLGGAPGNPDVTVTYDVSRVSTSDLK